VVKAGTHVLSEKNKTRPIEGIEKPMLFNACTKNGMPIRMDEEAAFT
jgi:hypothetical protein